MAFRKSVPQSELRQKLSPQEKANGPKYQASRGGWFSEPTKPVPGQRKDQK